jgi:hypothetical protein
VNFIHSEQIVSEKKKCGALLSEQPLYSFKVNTQEHEYPLSHFWQTHTSN